MKQHETRLQNCLLASGLGKVEYVQILTDAELLRITNFGRVTLKLARERYGEFIFDKRGDYDVRSEYDQTFGLRFNIKPK